jgi:hypothetical protein
MDMFESLRLVHPCRSDINGKRPTSPALAGRCCAWEVCSVIGKLVSRHDDGYGIGGSRAPATVDDL